MSPSTILLGEVKDQLEEVQSLLLAVRDNMPDDPAKAVDYLRRHLHVLVSKSIVILERAQERSAALDALTEDALERAEEIRRCVAEIELRSVAMTNGQQFWMN